MVFFGRSEDVADGGFDDVVAAQYLLIVFAFAGDSTMTSDVPFCCFNPVSISWQTLR